MLTRDRLVEYGIPIGLMLPLMLALVWVGDFGALATPIAALALGAIVRPRHLWVIWIASILFIWLAGGTWELWGDPDEAGAEEAVLSFATESIVFTALLVLLPMWLGRLADASIIRREPRSGAQ